MSQVESEAEAVVWKMAKAAPVFNNDAPAETHYLFPGQVIVDPDNLKNKCEFSPFHHSG